jgi:putative ubiquitin-RnfH superfamily antitoxin RatB of RatAB toxin-antitoxin module
LAAAESESAGLKTMHVEVVYALPDVQHRLHLELPEGSTVAAALDAVRRIPPFREMDLTAQTVGIFGRIVGPDELLGPEDRVEIYRPLKMDPKEARRRRAG